MSYQEQTVPKDVFRAYDIRGIINEHFDENAFYTIGRALSARLLELKRDSIFVGRDGRLSSERLVLALSKGLQAGGVNVIDLGGVATPVLYYATHEQGIDCGLVVTGSHNPSAYNGIKIVLAGKTLVQEDIEGLYNCIVQRQFPSKQGTYTTRNILEEYGLRVKRDLSLSRPLKVVVDCGNGIAGNMVPEVLKAFGCDLITLYCEVDGNFPNHHPDPSVEENLRDLKEAVAHHQADIGLAFDGDADRLGLVTNTGRVIWPDRLLMYFARALLQQKPGQTIVYDVKCSAHLAKVIEEHSGVALMCPTGHSIVKGIMKDKQAALAGEMSGHIFFKDGWYGFDDALYSACRLLALVSQSPLSVEEQFLSIPDSVNTPEIKIAIPEEQKFQFMQAFCEQAVFDSATIIRLDGLRVEFSKGWGLVRASNTTACLVSRFEADDEAALEQIQALFKEQLLKLDNTLMIPW